MGKYAYMGLWVKFALGNFYYVSKIPSVHTQKQIISVSVFLCTWQLTALLSKSFRILLHCYTLTHVSAVKLSNSTYRRVMKQVQAIFSGLSLNRGGVTCSEMCCWRFGRIFGKCRAFEMSNNILTETLLMISTTNNVDQSKNFA